MIEMHQTLNSEELIQDIENGQDFISDLINCQQVFYQLTNFTLRNQQSLEDNKMEHNYHKIKRQIIKKGHQFFQNNLQQALNNKKRKKNNKSKQLSQQINPHKFSIFNLIKVERKKLSSNQILAGELIKTNYLGQKRFKEQDDIEHLKYYEDYQQTQKLNKRFLQKFFIKPINKQLETALADKKLNTSLDVFSQKVKNMMVKMTVSEFEKLEGKYFPKSKLSTSRQMLEMCDNRMMYFVSDIKSCVARFDFQQTTNEFKKNLLRQTFQSVKNQLNQKQKISTTYDRHSQLDQFTSLLQSTLPQYLHRSYHQTFSPIPWRIGQLQKQLQRSKFPQITGKLLYKYEHNLIELKDKKIRMRVYGQEKKGFQRLKGYIGGLLQEKRRQMRRNSRELGRDIRMDVDYHNRGIQLVQPNYKRNVHYENNELDHRNQPADRSKQKDYISDKLISRNYIVPKVNQRNKPDLRPQHPLTPSSFQVQHGYDYRTANNPPTINIRGHPPQSSNYQPDNNQLNLDEYKFSKHSYFAQYQQQPLRQDKRKKSSVPRNIYLHEERQERYAWRQEKQYDSINNVMLEKETEENSLLPNNKYHNLCHNRSKSIQSPSGSTTSNYWQQIRKFEQGKTTKKKKSFIKKTPPLSSSHQGIKIKESRHLNHHSKKISYKSFYPLKLGNLILEKNRRCYLQYNSSKESIKNMIVKFLLDRQKHGVNQVEIVIPSLGHNQGKMTINDHQKAKQIMKIVLTLGGQVTLLKPSPSYNEEERKQGPKISAELQIYKFYYKELSYYEIIDALNLENQWLEKERENLKVGGWKY